MCGAEGEAELHIGLVLPTLAGGGAERVTLNLSEFFVGLGCEVDLIVGDTQGSFADAVPKGVDLVDLAASSTRGMLVPYLNYIKDNRPDVVYAGTYYTAPIVASCKVVEPDTAVTAEVENPVSIVTSYEERWTGRLSGWACAAVSSLVDAWIAVSKGVATDLEKEYGISAEKIYRIGNPFVLERILKKSSENVQNPWLKRTDRNVIVGVGRLVEQKNFEYLLRAFSELLSDSREMRLIILGEGQKRAQLVSLSEKLAISDKVEFTGFVENPYKYMRRADCLAVSSKWEGFGNVIVEGLSVNTPVVATNCPYGPAEILEHGRWGYLCQLDAPKSMAMAIQEAISDDSCSTMERADVYAIERVGREYYDLFESIL